MNKQNGIIYGLFHQDKIFYVGSTIQPLKKRKIEHKYNSTKNRNIPVYKKINEVGWNDVDFRVLEHVEFEGTGLRKKEQEWCGKYDNLCNIRRPYVSKEELRNDMRKYYLKNRDNIIKKRRLYRETHWEEIKEYNKRYYLERKQKKNNELR